VSATTAPPRILKPYDVRYFVALAAVALAYFGAAKLGLRFASSISQVTAIWPPTGIAVAALTLYGYRSWPAILIGAFAANVTQNEPVVTAAGIAVGNTLGPLAAVWALRRAGFDPTLTRVRDALMLMTMGALGVVITATNGVANLALANIVPWQAYFNVWWLWWMGDIMGILVVAPLILSWSAMWRVELFDRRVPEFALLCASMVVLALVVLDDPRAAQYKYMLFLGVVWAAMRFGQRGTSALVAVLVSLAVWSAMHGRGPFTAQNLDQRLIELELFAGALAVAGLVLATVAVERERASTSLRQTHDELAAAESRLRTVIANAPLVLWSTDTRGHFTFIDGAALAKLGMTGHQLIGRHYSCVAPSEEVALAMKGVFVGEACRRIGNYPSLGFETHLEPLRNERGKISGAIGVSIDVTERMHAEMEKQRLAERMQHAQKLESLGVLAGGIAHDFNNLLTPIVGNADLALMHSNDVVLRDHIEQIQIAAHRAADLTRQMLAYAGKRPFKIGPLNLSQAVEEMARLLGASVSKKAILRYQFARDLPLIEADSAQISQVAMNLITNASDALGDGRGTIVVSTGVMDLDAQMLAGCVFDDGVEPGRFVCLEVSDTGSGMDASISARMFEPFFTTKFAGRGLGLSAVCGIMRGHKGTLRVTSRPHFGTTMRALFPVGRSEAEPTPQPTTTDTSWRGHGTILVVDDEKSVREVSGGMLEALGFTVIATADGEGTLAAYQQSRDSIRAVLLDMTMPTMSGEDVFVALERMNPEVKIVLCSGYTEQDTAAHLDGRNLAGYLQKPFTAGDLVAIMRSVLGD
jgi:two-component system cell cycle sensor histidine kinase/response regulator CckA